MRIIKTIKVNLNFISYFADALCQFMSRLAYHRIWYDTIIHIDMYYYFEKENWFYSVIWNVIEQNEIFQISYMVFNGLDFNGIFCDIIFYYCTFTIRHDMIQDNSILITYNILLMANIRHHLGCPKCWFYTSIKTFWGILSGAGFIFHQPYVCILAGA